METHTYICYIYIHIRSHFGSSAEWSTGVLCELSRHAGDFPSLDAGPDFAMGGFTLIGDIAAVIGDRLVQCAGLEDCATHSHHVQQRLFGDLVMNTGFVPAQVALVTANHVKAAVASALLVTGSTFLQLNAVFEAIDNIPSQAQSSDGVAAHVHESAPTSPPCASPSTGFVNIPAPVATPSSPSTPPPSTRPWSVPSRSTACRRFRRTGPCKYGAQCWFKHAHASGNSCSLSSDEESLSEMDLKSTVMNAAAENEADGSIAVDAGEAVTEFADPNYGSADEELADDVCSAQGDDEMPSVPRFPFATPMRTEVEEVLRYLTEGSSGVPKTCRASDDFEEKVDATPVSAMRLDELELFVRARGASSLTLALPCASSSRSLRTIPVPTTYLWRRR